MGMHHPMPQECPDVRGKNVNQFTLRASSPKFFGRFATRCGGGGDAAWPREQGMKEQDWTSQATNQLKDVPAMHGRGRMREALLHLGFGLR